MTRTRLTVQLACTHTWWGTIASQQCRMLQMVNYLQSIKFPRIYVLITVEMGLDLCEQPGRPGCDRVRNRRSRYALTNDLSTSRHGSDLFYSDIRSALARGKKNICEASCAQPAGTAQLNSVQGGQLRFHWSTTPTQAVLLHSQGDGCKMDEGLLSGRAKRKPKDDILQIDGDQPPATWALRVNSLNSAPAPAEHQYTKLASGFGEIDKRDSSKYFCNFLPKRVTLIVLAVLAFVAAASGKRV